MHTLNTIYILRDSKRQYMYVLETRRSNKYKLRISWENTSSCELILLDNDSFFGMTFS